MASYPYDSTSGGDTNWMDTTIYPWSINVTTDFPQPCASQFDILAIKLILERMEAKMNDQPQAQFGEVLTERDDREHRALVMVLRALFAAEGVIADEYDVAKEEVHDSLAIAEFMWPEAYAEATRDDDSE